LGDPFNWTEECETAFQKLKITLITAPVLGFPDMSKHFLLDTDLFFEIWWNPF
jgi:hypothetical protein